MDDSEVFVRIFTGDTEEYGEENYSVDTVWEVEINRTNNRGNTCKVKYRQDYQDHSQTFRLRHFRTGKVLSYTDNPHNKDNKFRKRVAILGPHFEEYKKGEIECYQNSKITFKQTTVSQKNEMRNEDCYQIQFPMQDYLTVNSDWELKRPDPPVKDYGTNLDGTPKKKTDEEMTLEA